MEKTKMRLLIPAIVGIVFGAVAECHGAEASSTPSAVWVKPEESLQWKTVMSAGKPVALDWPTGAVSAQLTIAVDGELVVETNITDTAAREVLIVPSTIPAAYAEERVLSLSVEYRDGGDAEISSNTARLGWVTGVAGNGTRVIPAASGKEWTNVDKYAVLPIPGDTTALAVDSAAQTFDAPGWWEWRHVSAGEHGLVLTAGGENFAATLRGLGGGFILVVR
jgi:hypothetical protein